MISLPLAAQQEILGVDRIQPDMSASARTVFRGQQAEEFPLQILGVLRNSGPGQNIILAKLLTDRLEKTGVMQGMSGSPVYVGGKLIGAIAFAFPFAKEPIAGIRPIEEMLNTGAAPALLKAEAVHLGARTLVQGNAIGGDGPAQVLTPVSLGGFTARTIETFAGQWKQLGFVLQQGASGNQSAPPSTKIQPGDMISVQLIRGDMSAGADGTVTSVAGNQIYAFGHRFLGGGAVEFPFARAEVLTPLPNYNMPFKISQSLGEAGSILFDGDAAVRGQLGHKAKLTPVRIRFRDSSGTRQYNVEIVRHTLLSPLLLQMAIFSTLDHHFRSAGSGTVDLKGTIRFAGAQKPLEIEGRYAGDNNLPIAASLAAAIPFAFFAQHVDESAPAESIEFDLDSRTTREQWVIESASLSKRTAKPGDTLKIRALLSSPDGKEKSVEHSFTVPQWLPGGETLTLTVSDAFTTNLLDFRSFYQPGGPVFRSTDALIEALCSLHPSNAIYIRAMRSSPAYQTAGRETGNLPPSIAAVMQKTPGSYLPTYQSRLVDIETKLAEGVVSGTKTLTLEIEK